MTKTEFINELAKLRPNATFLSLRSYKNSHSEVGDYSVVFHISYKNALERSIRALQGYTPTSELEQRAHTELLDGYHASLQKMEETPVDEIDDAYTRFFDEKGAYIKGVKMHTMSGELHLYGLVAHKRILVPGTYPKTNKRELTIVKDRLRKLCPVNRFRQFKVLPEQVEQIVVEGMELLPPDATL